MSGRDRIRTALASAALAGLLAGCATSQAPPARAPAPVARVVPPPAPPAPPAAPPDWTDVALTPGGWSYSSDPAGSQAAFGTEGASAAFVLRCDRTRREISLSRPAAPGAAALVVRTSYGVRGLPAPRLAPSDSLFDEIAFSRGRFTVETDGAPTLVIPAWAEPARVIEDCRE
jgi:hypothetical protein